MITERQEQIENGLEVLSGAEDYIVRTRMESDSVKLIHELRSELEKEWLEEHHRSLVQYPSKVGTGL